MKPAGSDGEEAKMEMNLLKAEAERRLEYLVKEGLHPDVLDSFRKDVLYYSDCVIHDFPMLCYFTGENGVSQEWLDLVSRVEEEYDIRVYHISHCYTAFGELLNLLYITSAKEEWEEDWEDLRQGYPFSYVINLDEPYCSEFGSIGIRIAHGGIIRIA